MVILLGVLLLAAAPSHAPVAAQGEQTFGVDDVDGLSIDQRLLLVSLQGVVNREGPILWLRSGRGQSPGFLGWEQVFPELRGMIHLSYGETLDRFARPDRFAGIVVVDPSVEETYNIATNLAGQENLVIATPATVDALLARALPLRHDLRGRYRDGSEASAANLALFRTANQTMALKALRWSSNDYLYGAPERGRDLAIQQRYWTFSKASNDADLLDFYKNTIGPVRQLYGVAEDENLDIYRSSEAGKVWLGMGLQLQYNLSMFEKLHADQNYAYHQPAVPFVPTSREPGGDEVLVSFIMTEGDNPFFVINNMKVNWLNPDHGEVPIGWTIAPQMLDLAPAVLQYYYTTATPNDYFLAGASGYGYYHVNAMDFAGYPQLLDRLTPEYLRRLDIRMIRNFGDWLGYQMSFYDRLRLTATAYPELLGWVEGHGVPTPQGNPPVPAYERTTAVQLDGKYLDIPFSSWCDGDLDVDRTVAEIKDFIAAHPERPLPVLVGMDQKRATPSTVRAIMERLGPSYRYVRPDTLYRSRPTIIDTVATPQIGVTSAIVTWATDELAAGEVVIKGAGQERTVREVDLPVMKHELTLGQLAPQTTYTYHIVARDADGNTTRSEERSFITASAPPESRQIARWVAGIIGLALGCVLLSGQVLREWRRSRRDIDR